jgi:hypothetical protein
MGLSKPYASHFKTKCKHFFGSVSANTSVVCSVPSMNYASKSLRIRIIIFALSKSHLRPSQSASTVSLKIGQKYAVDV